MREIKKPSEIEQESFAILTRELGDRQLDPEQEPIIKRVIHTTADFEYADILAFSNDVLTAARRALLGGTPIITDTRMAQAGINKQAAAKLGCEIFCYMDDPEVAKLAKEQGTTRAVMAMEKASRLFPEGVYVIGNAPTALLRLCELREEGQLRPAFVVGVPVGFVNVVESKEALLRTGLPGIVSQGRKGGSTVAAAICNALMYECLNH